MKYEGANAVSIFARCECGLFNRFNINEVILTSSNSYDLRKHYFCSKCKETHIKIEGVDTYNEENAEKITMSMLVKCPACQKDISKEAEHCIHCGHPMSSSIKCPTCKSDNVQKISGASKVGSAVAFGIFSVGKLTKTYQCNKCGYRW